MNSNVPFGCIRADYEYQNLPDNDVAESSDQTRDEVPEGDDLLSIWKQQFIDAFMVLFFWIILFT